MKKSFVPSEAHRDAYDRGFMGALDAVVGGFQRHWLAVFNVAILLLTAGGFAGPAARAQGWDGLADGLWRFYRSTGICTSNNSYYLFGHQMCLCTRCTAIYSAMFVAGLGYAAMRRFLPPLPLPAFLLLTLPMAIDGFTQLFGWRSSDWLLRTVTGSLFGFACVWFIYPRFAAVNDQPDAGTTPPRHPVPQPEV